MSATNDHCMNSLLLSLSRDLLRAANQKISESLAVLGSWYEVRGVGGVCLALVGVGKMMCCVLYFLPFQIVSNSPTNL